MIQVPANLLTRFNLRSLSMLLSDAEYVPSAQDALVLLDVIKEHGRMGQTCEEATAIWNAKKLVRDWYTHLYYVDTYHTRAGEMVRWDTHNRDFAQHALISLADFLPEIPNHPNQQAKAEPGEGSWPPIGQPA